MTCLHTVNLTNTTVATRIFTLQPSTLRTYDVCHVTSDTRPLIFKHATLKSWEWPEVDAKHPLCVTSCTLNLVCASFVG